MILIVSYCYLGSKMVVHTRSYFKKNQNPEPDSPPPNPSKKKGRHKRKKKKGTTGQSPLLTPEKQAITRSSIDADKQAETQHPSASSTTSSPSKDVGCSEVVCSDEELDSEQYHSPLVSTSNDLTLQNYSLLSSVEFYSSMETPDPSSDYKSTKYRTSSKKNFGSSSDHPDLTSTPKSSIESSLNSSGLPILHASKVLLSAAAELQNSNNHLKNNLNLGSPDHHLDHTSTPKSSIESSLNSSGLPMLHASKVLLSAAAELQSSSLTLTASSSEERGDSPFTELLRQTSPNTIPNNLGSLTGLQTPQALITFRNYAPKKYPENCPGPYIIICDGNNERNSLVSLMKKIKNVTPSDHSLTITKTGVNRYILRTESYSTQKRIISMLDSTKFKTDIPSSLVQSIGIIQINKNTNIFEEFESYCSHAGQVNRVERLMKNKTVPTNIVKIYFNLNNLPQDIRIGNENYKISVYRPMIKICFKCNKIGHMSRQCKGSARCRMCAGNHNMADCPGDLSPVCLGCKSEGHIMGNKRCPLLRFIDKYIFEIYSNKTSYSAVIKEYFRSTRPPPVYAHSTARTFSRASNGEVDCMLSSHSHHPPYKSLWNEQAVQRHHLSNLDSASPAQIRPIHKTFSQACRENVKPRPSDPHQSTYRSIWDESRVLHKHTRNLECAIASTRQDQPQFFINRDNWETLISQLMEIPVAINSLVSHIKQMFIDPSVTNSEGPSTNDDCSNVSPPLSNHHE